MFKLLGVLLALYVARSIARGEVTMKSGLWAKTVGRAESPTEFWICIAIYSGLAVALLTVF